MTPVIRQRKYYRGWSGRKAELLGRPTIADCAVMPYVALAPEGGISLEAYPNIRQWIARIKALPGFIPMPGI